jgi:hypothetical protein
MANDTKFKLGQYGNPQSKFKAGSKYRWQPGQSGNPAGIAWSRLQFENVSMPLCEQGAAEEAASLLWGSARKRVDDEPTVDYRRLSDEEIEHLERLRTSQDSSWNQ